jgi:hypothetical protein
MYASEILVPRTDEIKGNSRKSQEIYERKSTIPPTFL